VKLQAADRAYVLQQNVDRILEAVDSPIPLLLEGATGVGKSATIQEAARITGNELVRFNMSSGITIDDLLGKMALVMTPDGEDFQLQKQPFTEAFEQGKWLLLDELNLAPDIVLQCVETALDTGKLQLGTMSTVSTEAIQMHPSFRLFAAQNPGTGFFKGKREALSATFLDRCVSPCGFFF